jgi:prepilin-type N-terminal cleavage/methylation domain-containing protein
MTIRRDMLVRRQRRGFTLVEMMVAMAISLGIMMILAEGIQSGLEFVRISNSNAQLMNQNSGACNRLEHDLMAQSGFFVDPGKRNGGRRLSDQWMHTPGWTTPQAGFFRIEAGRPIYEVDALGNTLFDVEGNTLATATSHRLHFTTILRGDSDAELFLGLLPASNPPVYRSQVAEVAWFWVPTGEFTSAGPNRLPLGNLMRRYRLVARDDETRTSLDQAVQTDTSGTHPEVISVPNPNPGNVANTLVTVRDYQNRLQLPPGPAPVPATSPSPVIFPPGNARYGEDVVATNVISFQVGVWWDGNPALGTQNPRGYYATAPDTVPNTDAPYDYLYQGGGVFDTRGPANNPNAVPQRIRVRALKVTIRIADIRVGIAKSITREFDM